jgi:hypothetical protein
MMVSIDDLISAPTHWPKSRAACPVVASQVVTNTCVRELVVPGLMVLVEEAPQEPHKER